MEDALVWIVVIAALLFGLWAALWIMGIVLHGAMVLLSVAADQGLFGVAAYAACWVFLLPIMLAACVIAGLISHRTARHTE